VYLPPFGPFGDPAALVDLAVRAEAAGWDGVFLWDHVVHDDLPIVDAWSVLAAIAAVTSRITIGPTVTPLPRRRPWIVARQAATVDALSGGRLVLGVGLGSDESGDFSAFGEELDMGKRAAMLDEGIDVVRSMWPGGPIWVAAGPHPAAGVVRRARAAEGAFVIADHLLTPDEVARFVRAVGHPGPFDVAVAGNASRAWEVPNPSGADLAALADAGATWWMESLIHFDPLEQSLAVVDAGPP
jgi:alkanesulfonate monooxygenase SsuD/methylene tetrahydromethanopterin reductase-like flavin-dependent oxidoreductase (luciferase family)